MKIDDDIQKAAYGCLAGWTKTQQMANVARALQAERDAGKERLREAEGLLFRLSSVSTAVLVGAAVHNDRGGSPKIEGPLITQLADAAQSARAFLVKEGK